MPTTRTRRRRHRLPEGFEALHSLELIEWAVHGPDISPEPALRGEVVTVYPSWEAWANFYGQVREEFLAWRRGTSEPACERLYECFQAGGDPEALWWRIGEELEAKQERLYRLLDGE